MKKLFLGILFCSSLIYAQMPNISSVWLNKGNPYSGTIEADGEKTILKLKFNLSEQNKNNDQEYFISGTSEKDGAVTNIEGNVKVTKYKDGKKSGKMFGTYELAEKPNGKASGLYKGDFVFKFSWNPKTQTIDNHQIEFKGTWTDYNSEKPLNTVWTSSK